MILQTKATTLVALMSADGRKSPDLQTYDVNILGAWSDDIDLPRTISNDRTTLKHQIQKKT